MQYIGSMDYTPFPESATLHNEHPRRRSGPTTRVRLMYHRSQKSGIVWQSLWLLSAFIARVSAQCPDIDPPVFDQMMDLAQEHIDTGERYSAIVLAVGRWCKSQDPPVKLNTDQRRCWLAEVKARRAVYQARQERIRREEERKRLAEEAKRKKEEGRKRAEEKARRETILKETGGAERILRGYLSAPTVHDRLKYCFLRTLDERAFVDWYLKYRPGQIGSILRVDEEDFAYDVCFTSGAASECSRYYLTFIKDGFLVDWPRSVGANEITISTAVANRTTARMWFWVRDAELSSYYHSRFSDSDARYWSVAFWASNRWYLGYIRRGTDAGAALGKHLEKHKAALTLLLQLGHSDDKDGVLEIVDWKPEHSARKE